MARAKMAAETRKAIRESQKMIQELMHIDGNEAETRRRVERIIHSLMGYDVFKHVTREHAVQGPGEIEYCDFAVQLDNAEPIILIELKRVNVDLATKHIKQAASYAINKGCEWVMLSNGREWQLYHISFGQPPQTKLIYTWNILNDSPALLAERFEEIGFKNVKKGGLDALWKKRNVLSAGNLLETILSEDNLRRIRRELRRTTGIMITPEEIVSGIRRLLNEAANNEMETIKISLPNKKKRKTKLLEEKNDNVLQ